MNRLWAPWRMEYLESDKSEGCIFCEKPAKNDDAAEHIVLRGEHAYLLLNKYPYANGHLMVAPYAHAASFESLDRAARAELMELTTRAVELLRQVYNPNGFNVGANIGKAAGAGFGEHVHLHIVPRWSGDTNYMSVVGETRVIPEMLDESYRRLVEALKQH